MDKRDCGILVVQYSRTMIVTEPVDREVVVNDVTPAQRGGLTLVRFVYYVLDVIIIALLLRLVLRFLGANPDNQFVNWVYSVTQALVAPFRGIFPPAEASAPFEWATIVAMIVYTLIAYAIARLVEIITRA